ncbi:MAG: winged helix-turn-helix domain-containing protein [Erysipelotrichaceae bacterium]|nr:winged helix-turn-helix domain-containing protein [Erysipelotrichaceae bacterium]MDY5251195.1 BTAD domain-containing putative transcriptional regulator [Erysipelotrichaceae bacterium]
MKLRLNFFGSLTAEIDDVTIDLEKLLGKQLSGLFAMLAYYHGKVVSKEKFISTLWQDSDNPTNALKYAIFRLRNGLKEVDAFKDIEVVETVKTGYQLNLAIDVTTDFELFEKSSEVANKTGDIEDYKLAMSYYKGDFLASWDNEWIYLERAHYKIAMINLAENMSNKCLELKDYELCLKICRFALGHDDFNEELIYAYIKALIETKQYNEALKYYDSASKKMNRELGVGLQDKTSSLLNVFSANNKNNDKADLKEFSDSLYDVKDLKGAMQCDYSTFKMITQYEVRTCIRHNRSKYIIFVSFVNDQKDIDALSKVVLENLRIDDVYTKVSDSQIAILCSLRQNSDAYIVGERIVSKYYRKVNSNARLMYKLKLLTDEKALESHSKGSLFVV